MVTFVDSMTFLWFVYRSAVSAVCLFQIQMVTLDSVFFLWFVFLSQMVTFDSVTFLSFVSLRSLLCLSCLTIMVSLHCELCEEDLAVLSSWIKQ